MIPAVVLHCETYTVSGPIYFLSQDLVIRSRKGRI